MVFSDTIVKAIAWTLIHSIWQGIVLAVGAGLIVLATKKTAAVLRYNLLSALFMGFLMIVGFTFNYELVPRGVETTTRLNLPIVQQPMDTEFSGVIVTDFSNTVIEFLNRNANLIALIWFAIFAIKLIGIFNSLNHIYRIRNYKTFSPSDYWKNRIGELANQIQLHKSIVLLESALVKIPSVTGIFKPVILVPIGMLSNLPQDQVEAILLHELAHIRRKDFVMNLLQHLAEVIFFFNPGLLWLSSLLKDEREHCCDDIALDVIGNKANFVHALVSFTEYNMGNPLAVGFAGKKNHLLSRAKRIIYDDNKSLNAIEKTFLSASLLVVAIIMIACANPTSVDEVNHLHIEADLANEQAQQRMEMDQEVIERTAKDTEMQAKDTEMQAKDTEVQAKDTEIQTKDSQIYAAMKKAEADRKTAENAAIVANQSVVLAGLRPIVAPVNALICTPEPTSKKQVTRTVTSKTKTSQSYEKEETTYDSSNANNNKHVTLRTGVSGEDLPENINVDFFTSGIISDLKKENIIKNTNGLSYKLSNTSLIVNGIKQPENVHAKLRNKYVKAKMYAICYNYEYSGDIPIN